jgi:hypothetical protein
MLCFKRLWLKVQIFWLIIHFVSNVAHNISLWTSNCIWILFWFRASYQVLRKIFWIISIGAIKRPGNWVCLKGKWILMRIFCIYISWIHLERCIRIVIISPVIYFRMMSPTKVKPSNVCEAFKSQMLSYHNINNNL